MQRSYKAGICLLDCFPVGLCTMCFHMCCSRPDVRFFYFPPTPWCTWVFEIFKWDLPDLCTYKNISCKAS